jgi:N-methylhydantoinase A
MSLEGPTIVTQYDTTTFVPPGYRVSVDQWLNLIGEIA